MAKAKKITPVNPHNNFQWSELLDPAAVKPKSLPLKAGVYLVVACDPNGKPVKFAAAPAETRFPGVVYIGLTGKDHTLQKRFMQVARAWRVKHGWSEPPHGSRKRYNADPEAQKLFAVANVRIRYAPLPTDPPDDQPGVKAYTAGLNITPAQFREAFGMPLTGDKLVGDSEAIAMQQFKRELGYIPILNRREEGRGDRKPTAAELDDFLKNT